MINYYTKQTGVNYIEMQITQKHEGKEVNNI